MIKSIFTIPKMDCPCEERMIRMKLQEQSYIERLTFDLAEHRLEIIHRETVEPIDRALASLNLGSRLESSLPFEGVGVLPAQEHLSTQREKELLWWVLGINFLCFIVEGVWGIWARSMGLVADSLDMLADAFVYGLALLAIGRSVKSKKSVALWAGILQLALAGWGIIEVVERFFSPEVTPNFLVMIVASVIALAGNAASLLLLNRAQSKEAHMEASRIFTSNDVIVNIGVIASAIIVALTNSRYPDLIVGSFVFLLVLRGAIRILRLA
ncbi:cation transporter [Porphyromonas circumdentaria]|uniref:Cation efflux family protein n=1 Tax=Porphyromonas circumdentaria TaxID=29524 RepID=A0A1T4MPJ6_9PORP|nr:cation transporter [Porphyromonas circumdentaria]MBB6275903.1 Co/Zn/Cd efflux system component [Porphyromonas circumdentaria]SJZ69040.1 Cation efflux family protein [Porphyromonas circumdentaria]